MLAGGAGSRLRAARLRAESSKATISVAGRPLVSYPLAVLGAVCDRVPVVAKRDTRLPALGAVERWDEPDEPRHPLVGIVHALERAQAPVLVCAADMPFVTVPACRRLLEVAASAGGRAAASASVAVVAYDGNELEPLLGVYAPEALPVLRSAAAGAPLRATIEALDPVRVPLPPAALRSVNTPGDLAAAEAELASQGAEPG